MTVRSDNQKRRSGPLVSSGGSWRLLIIPVLLIMILPLGVNAMMFRNDTAHTGVYYDVATPPNNVLLWNYSFGGFKYNNATEFTYIMDNSTYASPAVVNGVVYEGSLGNNMTAFNAMTGAVLWDKRFDGDIHASPAVDSARNVVYFTNYDAKLYALKTADGSSHWVSPADIGAPSHSSPAILGDTVYVGSDNGVVYAFDADNGDERWSNETNSTPVAGGVALHSSPAVVKGWVYIGNDDGNLYALNATDGKTGNWHYTTGGPVKSSPAVVDDVVYFGSNDGKLYAIDAILGTDFFTPFSESAGSAIESSPAVAGGVVYFGSYNGGLYAISASAGTRVSPWPFDTGKGIKSSPAVANNRVYVGNNDGKIFCIDVNGTKIWEYTTTAVDVRNEIFSSPAVANGVVYIGGGEGNTNLYAIGNLTSPVQQPVAAFMTNVTRGTAPLSVLFNDTSTGGTPTAWNWSFGDGVWYNTTDSAQRNTTHTYTVAGSPVATLTVSNGGGSSTSLGTTITVDAAPTAGNDGIAIFRNSTGYWYFDYNLDGTINNSFRYGGVGDQIIKGNWQGTIDGIAIFRPSTGFWYFDYNLDGIVDKSFRYGGVGDQIIKGNWQGTNDGIAIFRPSTGFWYFDYNLDGVVDKSFRYGGSTDRIIVGNWQGTNDGIAIFRPSTGFWYFDYNLDGVVNTTFRYGGSSDRIIKGNWQGTNDGIAIFRPLTGFWYFDYNLDGVVDKSYRYGGVGDQIIAGNWQGANDGIAIFRPSTGFWYFDYNLDSGVDKSFRYGGSTDQIIAGTWV